MKYEIVKRSVNTGAIVSVDSGYMFEDEALEEAALIEAEEDGLWCEVRRERF